MEQKYYAPPFFSDPGLSLEPRGKVVFVLSEAGSFRVLSSVPLDTSVAFFSSDVLDLFDPADFGVLPCAVSVDT